MSRVRRVVSRLLFIPLSAAVVLVAVYALSVVDEAMTVRYQAAGVVTDVGGRPIPGVEAILLLEPPPPAGPQLDSLFHREGVAHERHGAQGRLKRSVGPTIGLSDSNGIYVVRVSGRLGAAHAIRLGLDSGGRPAFERAWLVLRHERGPDVMKTLSILGWRKAPKGWGSFVNRLPKMVLDVD